MADTYAEAHHLTACARCGAEPDELFCVDELSREEPDAWECAPCIRRRYPGAIEPEWEMLRSSEEVRELARSSEEVRG